MKKAVWLMLVAVFLGGIYIGSSLFMGKKIEKIIDQQYKLVETLPYAKLVRRDYHRGMFSSEETVTLEFFGEMMQAMARAQATKGQPAAMPKNFEVNIHTRIHHGPFPDFSRLAAAVGESELILPDFANEKVKQVFGDKKPISSQTVFHFDGGCTSIVKSPAVSVTLPPDPSGTIVSLFWEGLETQIDVAPDLQQYTMSGRAPKVEIKDNKNAHVLFSNLSFEADQKRIYQDEPLLFSGSQLFSVEEMRLNKPNDGQFSVIMKQLKYGIDMPFSSDFVDVAEKMGFEEVQVGDQKFGPAHFDLTFKHLHARTIADMYHGMLKMYSNPIDFTGQSPAAAAQFFAPLRDQVKALLGHQPEFTIDRISFQSPAGEMHLAAKVKLNDVTPEDLDNPVMLLAKMEASGEASVPEEMLMGIIGSGAGKQASSQQQEAQVRAQIAKFSELGYITNENQQIKIHAEFKEGHIKLNGKPFPPNPSGPEATRQPNM